MTVVIALLVTLLWQAHSAAAQEPTPGKILIGAPQTVDFPTIRFRMEAYDADGNFLSNLRPTQLNILEAAQVLQPDQIQLVPNGLQLIVALNSHPNMNAPLNGTTQFAEIQSALAEWAAGQSDNTLDDFSLATPTGLHLIRSTEASHWEKAIREYQPDLARLQPNLTSLADALDLATDPLGQPEMKRAIVFITPPLPPSLLGSIPDYTSRAQQIGVKVYVWLITTSSNPSADNPGALQDLAALTGGRFNVLTPSDLRPDIEAQIKPLRSLYEVSYTSAIQQSGSHQLAVRLTKGDLELVSEPRDLPVTVLPPNPIFLSPPPAVQILVDENQSGEAPLVSPGEIPLKIVIEFPDQHQREIKATRLYVNGKLVAENLKPPFDQFMWKMAEINETGPQMLRVEALDALNLSGASLEIPVNVTVEKPSAASPISNLSSRGWVAILAVLLSGGALGVVLVVSGRRKRLFARRRRADKNRKSDPITQPVPGVGEVYPARNAEPISRPRVTAASGAPARLVSLMDNEQPIPGGAIPIFEDEISFGSDPTRAREVLESPTIDGLHARLFIGKDGFYYLADQNTVAGTWINYAPVAAHGARLESGDLVHIGRVMFRFEIADPNRVRRREVVVHSPPIEQQIN